LPHWKPPPVEEEPQNDGVPPKEVPLMANELLSFEGASVFASDPEELTGNEGPVDDAAVDVDVDVDVDVVPVVEDEEKEDVEPKEPKPDPDPKPPNDEPEPNDPNPEVDPELDPKAPKDALGFSAEREEEEEDDDAADDDDDEEEDENAPAKMVDVDFGSVISFFHPKEIGAVFAGELVVSFPSEEEEEEEEDVVDDSV